MSDFTFKNGIRIDQTKVGIPKSILYHSIDTKEDLIPIIVNLSNNIKTIITIYGILLLSSLPLNYNSLLQQPHSLSGLESS